MRRARATDGKPVFRFPNGLQVRVGNLYAGGGLLIALIALAGVSSGLGITETGILDLLPGFSGAQLSGDRTYALWTVRLPRIALGFMAGWVVALAGAMLQSIARNPLADPGLFGFSQGSMTMIMLLLVLAPAASKIMIVLAALSGGLAVAFLLILLVGRQRTSGLAILLMGIAIETVLSSAGSILILYAPAETSLTLAEWMAGSLFQANWPTIALLLPLLLLTIPGIALLGPSLSVFDLGNDMALSLGEPVILTRPLILVFAVCLSTAAVTTVGPLMFLGVLAPHLAGFLSPAVGRARLFLSALTGGILVVGADALARGLAGDIPLPIGLSLTLIGVPLFIIALRLQALRRMSAH